MTEIQTTIQQLTGELEALDSAALELLKGRGKGDSPAPILLTLLEMLEKTRQLADRRNGAKTAAAALESFSGACNSLLTVGNDAATLAELRQRAYQLYLRTVEAETAARTAFVDADDRVNRTARHLREMPDMPAADLDAVYRPMQEKVRTEVTPRFVAAGKAKL